MDAELIGARHLFSHSHASDRDVAPRSVTDVPSKGITGPILPPSQLSARWRPSRTSMKKRANCSPKVLSNELGIAVARQLGQQALERLRLGRLDQMVIESGGCRSTAVFGLAPTGQRHQHDVFHRG
jgi:hypothetical protein